MLKRTRFLILPALVAFLLLLHANRTIACFCVPSGSPTEELARSAAVFSGTVIDIDPASESLWGNVESVYVTFQVARVWKGPRDDTVKVLTAREGINCGYEFKSGQTYLVYAEDSDNGLSVWVCSRTRLLAEAGEDLEALGEGDRPEIEIANRVGVEVHASSHITGKRETSQSFAYFVPWDWLQSEDGLIRERVEFAFWNMSEKAPIVSRLLWHGSVYGGFVKKGVKLVLIEKLGNDARMTGPWEFGGDVFNVRIGADDQPLVAEMIHSQVTIYHNQQQVEQPARDEIQRYTVQTGDTLWEIAGLFDTTIAAIAQANNIVNVDLILEGQELIIPAALPADD